VIVTTKRKDGSFFRNCHLQNTTFYNVMTLLAKLAYR